MLSPERRSFKLILLGDGFQLLLVGCWLSVAGSWLLIAGCGLLFADCSWLAVGGWLLSVSMHDVA